MATKGNRLTVYVLTAVMVVVGACVALAQDAQLPVDTSVKFTVREMVIEGNTRIDTAELLKTAPATYNVSGKPLKAAPAEDLYDISAILALAAEPGSDREVTARAIQGFTRYILSEYQSRGYSGVYVFVPAETIVEGIELKDKTLVIRVVEAEVSQVGINLYNVDKEKKDKSYLDLQTMKQWSPAKEGRMMNEKKLDDFMNQINLNPDKHLSAVISKGEDKSLSVGYDLYERTPWHFYLQADSSGTEKRQWSPRVGIMNTDLTGRMDRATVVYQAKPDELDDNYAVFGSYEVPLWTPALKLMGFAGYSEYDTNPVGTSPFTFQGSGYFYGGRLRYNVIQWDKWFFDITGGVTHQRSRYTPNLFASVLASDLRINYWSVGAEMYRNDDLTATRLGIEKYTSFGGSSDAKFDDARTDTDSDFCYYVVSASRSQFLDIQRVHRLVAFGRYMIPGERLTPSAMTTFGGLYTVRGYDEDEVVADGGLVASVQYEYDLIAAEAEKAATSGEKTGKQFVRRLAPVVFADMGRAVTKDPVPGERGVVELASIGTGFVTTLGDNFEGSLYYGWALRSTEETDAGDGHLGASVLLRW
jgi:hemolysin activation/secretion protein